MGVFRFVGGPLDGASFDHEQVNTVGLVMPAAAGRSFVFMPSAADCDRIIRGEIERDQAERSLQTYECVRLPGGGAEFHHTSGAELSAAMRAESAPPSEGEAAQQAELDRAADRLVEQVRVADLSGGSLVTLVCDCVDASDNPAPPIRLPVTPERVTVKIPGDPEAAKRWAADAFRDALVGNVSSAVRGTPAGYVGHPELQGKAVRIVGFRLTIE